MPSAELVQQMREECPGVDLRAEHLVFIDYWIAQPGARGVKVDWAATWRNWMRKKQNESPTLRAIPGGKQTAGERARAIAEEFRREGM